MHVAVLGAGALGRAYGVRLAADGVEVTFVVRPERAGQTEPYRLEQINGAKRQDAVEAPVLAAEIPARADVVLVAVRFDQLLSPGIAELLRKAPASAPIVLLTPLVPAQKAALDRGVGRATVSGMPGVSGYLDERGVVRYWVVGVTSTLFDEARTDVVVQGVEQLARRLTKLGVPARIDRDVATTNAATTIAFFPFIAAIDVGGGIDGILGDKPLLGVTLDAAKEAETLAKRVGKIAAWATILTKFVGPFTLRPGIALGRRLSPEAVRFVELHFGPKLHAQHVAMAAAIASIARELGVETPALAELQQALAARPRS